MPTASFVMSIPQSSEVLIKFEFLDKKLSFDRKEAQKIDDETFEFFYEILKEAKKISIKLNRY